MAKRQNGCDPGYGVLHVFPACHEMPWLLRQGFILETHSLRNLWIHTYTSYSRVGLERRMTCHVVLWWDEQRSPCATSAEAAAPQRMSGVSKTPREDNIPRKISPTSATRSSRHVYFRLPNLKWDVTFALEQLHLVSRWSFTPMQL
jgi:hypothetical protein